MNRLKINLYIEEKDQNKDREVGISINVVGKASSYAISRGIARLLQGIEDSSSTEVILDALEYYTSGKENKTNENSI